MSEGTKSIRYAKWLCLLVVIVVGSYFRLSTAAHTEVDHPVRNDAMDYVAYAWNLKFHGVYSRDSAGLYGHFSVAPKPDAKRPPVYSLMLLPLVPRTIDGTFIRDSKDLQAWIAIGTLLVSAWLAMELLGDWAGLGVAILVAISPHQSIYVAYLLTETLYGLVLMLALAVGVLALKAQQPRRRLILAGLCGVLFGLSCLIRPTLDQWALVLLVLLVVPPMRRFRREILMLGAGFVLTMAPWWARNYVSVHELSDSTRMRLTVQQGSYPDFMYQGQPETYGYPYRFDPNLAKWEKNWSGVFEDLRGKFKRAPGAMLRWYLFGKITFFFGWSPPDGWRGMFTYPVLDSPWLKDPPFIAATSLLRTMYAPLIVCGVLGMLVVWLPWTSLLFGTFRTDAMRWLALLHLYAIGVHVVGAPFARYSVPFRPLTFLLAVFFLLWLARVYALLKQQAGERKPVPSAIRSGGMEYSAGE